MKPSGRSGCRAPSWLLEQWTDAVANALESLTSERPTVCEEAATPSGEDPVQWREQTFNIAAEPLAWAGAARPAWMALGSRALRAAGIEEVSDDDARDTYIEILNQCFSGLATALTGRRGEEVACGAAGESGAPPDGVELHVVRLRFADGETADLYVGFVPSLAGPVGADGTAISPGSAAENPPPAGLSSKTLDILLDVELPVSVSFGKTEMALQDLLKLGAGSIVELNRSIDDPVELIVNNSVVARGEVVVIDGNYGVRIREIASREKRLWTTQSAQRET